LAPFSGASGAILPKILQITVSQLPISQPLFRLIPSSFPRDVRENVFYDHYNIGEKLASSTITTSRRLAVNHIMLPKSASLSSSPAAAAATAATAAVA